MWTAAATETNWHGESFKALTNLRCAAHPSAPLPAMLRVYNCAELHRVPEQLSPALRAQSGISGADETRLSLLPSIPSCGASSSLTQPSRGFGGSQSSEGFPLTPTRKVFFLSAEAAAKQDTEKTHFFRACFPSYVDSLQLSPDCAITSSYKFVLLIHTVKSTCPHR